MHDYLLETKAVQSSAFSTPFYDMVISLDTVETSDILIQAHFCFYHRRSHLQIGAHPLVLAQFPV